MKVLIAHPGTQYSYQLVKQLEKIGILYQFWTGFSVPGNGIKGKLVKLLPRSIFNKISNRILSDVPPSKIKTLPFLEFRTLYLLYRINNNNEAVISKRNKRFQELIPSKALREADIIIGFDTSSYILAERCHKLGKKFILDVSIAHPLSKKYIYEHIAERYPDWIFALNQKQAEFIRLEEKEMEYADCIVVASTFTKRTLIENGVNEKKININPYGVNSDGFKPALSKLNTKINFLFVGLVDARKGVPLLLEVWKEMDHSKATLTLLGPIQPTTKMYIETTYNDVIITGKVPFDELKQLMPQYDVLLFPSYFEGFGLVIPEAMACGLPVITTTATCGPDIFQNGREGFIISPGSAEKLKEAIKYFIQEPEKIYEMGLLARKRAEELSWEAYGNRWNTILMKLKGA